MITIPRCEENNQPNFITI